MRFLRKLWDLINMLLVIVMMFLAVALVGVRVVGLTPYAVLSGSMEPTYHVGSLIYVKDIDPTQVEIGDPITFIVNEDLLLATHRVVDKMVVTEREAPVLNENEQPVLDENGAPVTEIIPLDEPVYYFQTKGDANEDVDGAPVHYKNIVGKPVFSIPLLGYLSSYLQTRKGMIMGVSVALVLIILTFLPDLLNWVDDDKSKSDKRKKDQEKLEAEAESTPAEPYTHQRRSVQYK